MIRGTLLLIGALYVVAALLWAVDAFWFPRTPRTRVSKASEYVGKSCAALATGLAVLLLLTMFFRWVGLLPAPRR